MASDTAAGRAKLDWARAHMPIHARLRELYGDAKPFDGLTVAVCSHLEAKTGVFIETVAAAGAQVAFTASESMSTQDDVVAALSAQAALSGYARHGLSDEALEATQLELLDFQPDFILDDGAELTARLVNQRPQLIPRIQGVCEQTTTGVHRLEAMARQGMLGFPAYAVNDTPMKHYFDNVHGTGESSLTNLVLTTNLLLAGKCVVIAGFGYCGEGLATKARAWGARALVTEIDPRRALKAHMEGFSVMPMDDAATLGDVFVTATGSRDVIRGEHIERMRDGAILANAGHFGNEVKASDLEVLAGAPKPVRPGIEAYRLADGRQIYLLAQGRLVNLAAPGAMGHPAEVMDQTFAMQFMAAVHLLEHRATLGNEVYPVPDAIDRRVAEIKLDTLDIRIDALTDSQRDYMDAWRFEDIKR